MKQKVFVQGRETQPNRIIPCNYIPSKEPNVFSDIMHNKPRTEQNNNGFHIRKIGDGKRFLDESEWKRRLERKEKEEN